jgi:protein-L-isoaspartate(D-aspartate) O-methyltransferase
VFVLCYILIKGVSLTAAEIMMRLKHPSFILFTSIAAGALFAHTPLTSAMERDPFLSARTAMVRQQIQARGIKDPAVVTALLQVKRHLFVPEKIRHAAYDDRPLPIGYQQTISQPFIVALMTEALMLQPGDRVLEIGTGSGYQAAILAELAAEVYTIEIVAELAASSESLLKTLGYDTITVKAGDGYQGWEEFAPFDAIIVTAAPKEIPEKLIEQLKTGGRMVVPVGDMFQELLLIEKTERGIITKKLLPVRFVPMVRPE